jgi:HEAT repeat protein
MIADDRSKYLQFVLADPRYCGNNSFYTATDALLTLEAEIVQKEETPAEGEKRTQKQIERLPVVEMLRKYGLGKEREHLLLAGKPGSGKSTTLRRLCVEMAEIALGDNLQPIPVFVQLKGDKQIVKLIQAEFRRAKLRVTDEQIDDLLLEDKLVLLLDGVNEIPSEELRRELQDFRENNLTTPTIFTTRDLTVGGSLSIDKRLEMRPLTEEQMREFVHKYLPEHGDKLLDQLRDRLPEIAETPLLLKMLCEVFEPETGRIPQNKAELFELFDRKYQSHKEGATISADSRRFQSEILQYLAFMMLQGDIEKPTEAWLTLPRDRAEGMLEAWLKQRGETDPASKAKEWLEDLVKHHLLQVAADPQQIEFHHQLFQEYYAARYLRSMLQDKHPDLVDDERLKHFYLNYLKWTEPLGLLLGLLDDEVQAKRLVGLSLEVDLVLGSRLAGQVKFGFQSRLIQDIKTRELPIWLKIYLLGCTGSKEAKMPLLSFLESNELDIAINAVSALQELNSLEIVPELKLRLGKIDKWIAADPSPTHPYIEAGSKTLSSEAVKLEVKIAELLVQLSPKDAKQTIDNYLNNSNSFLDYFSLSNEVNELVIQYARRSKENIEEKLLRELCKSNSINRISQLAGILSVMKSEKASAIVIHHLNHTEDRQCYTAIVDLLGKFDNKESLEALVKLVGHSDSNIRVKAAQSLAMNKGLNAIPFLEPILKNQDFDTRWRVSILLADLGVETAIKVLAEGLNHEDCEIRSQSAKSLGSLSSEKVKEFLVKALEDPIYSVRRSAAIALAKLGCEEAITELLKALRDYYPDDPKLTDSKVEFELSDDDKTEQRQGFIINGFDSNTIERIGDYSAIKQWIYEQKLNRWYVIQEVVDALKKFNTDEVREKLNESLRRGDHVAAIALAHFGDIEMAPYLIEMLDSDHYRIEQLDRISALLANLIDKAQDYKRDSLISGIITRLKAPEHKSYYFRNRLAIVLIRVNSAYVFKYISELMTFMDTKAGKQSLWAIESIQYNCKLYNYDISRSPLPSTQPLLTGLTVYGDYINGDKIEGNKTENNFPTATEVKIFENVDRYYQTPPP